MKKERVDKGVQYTLWQKKEILLNREKEGVAYGDKFNKNVEATVKYWKWKT